MNSKNVNRMNINEIFCISIVFKKELNLRIYKIVHLHAHDKSNWEIKIYCEPLKNLKEIKIQEFNRFVPNQIRNSYFL